MKIYIESGWPLISQALSCSWLFDVDKSRLKQGQVYQNLQQPLGSCYLAVIQNSSWFYRSEAARSPRVCICRLPPYVAWWQTNKQTGRQSKQTYRHIDGQKGKQQMQTLGGMSNLKQCCHVAIFVTRFDQNWRNWLPSGDFNLILLICHFMAI